DFVRRLQAHLDAIGQQVQIENASENANDVGMVPEHDGNRLSDVARACRDPEDAIGLVVDQCEPAVAGDRENAIAHPRDDVPEKRVVRAVGVSRGDTIGLAERTRRGPPGRRRRRYARTRFGHHTRLHEMTSTGLEKAKRVPSAEFWHPLTNRLFWAES